MAYKNKKNQKWWPNCSVCQYMKKTPDFREAVMRSSYLDPEGQETLLAVNARYGSPFKLPTLYRHMQKHQAEDIQKAEDAARVFGTETPNWQRRTVQAVNYQPPATEPADATELLKNTEKAVEGDVVPRQQHEIALDDFIKLGRERVRKGEIVISASNYIAAIKVKADIERSTKDRRLEMLRTMFAGAAPKGVQDGSQPQ
jgi:hypothetical protein